MADNQMKLELVLLGKDLLGKILAKDIGFLRQFSKTGTEAAKSADKLDAARKKSAGAGGAAATAAAKEAAATQKLGSEAEKAARAEEKLNNARRKPTGDNLKSDTKTSAGTGKAIAAEEKLAAAQKKAGGAAVAAANATAKETADTKKLGEAAEKAAKSEEKLNQARQRKTADGSLKQETADKTKLAGADEKAAVAEEKLNHTRRKSKSADGAIKQETADTKKLGDAAERAAKSEEKLNNARKRGAVGGRRDGRKRTPTDNPNSPHIPNNPNSPRSLVDDAALAGAGATGLLLSKKGFDAGMSQQEAFTNLRNTFYRSSLSAAELNSQMAAAEKLTIQLGNDLPGTTTDYALMLAQLKQGGLLSQTALAAGKSTAYLAVTNKEDPTETAKRQAQFGQIFGLKTEKEFNNAADLMSRFKTSKGIDSTELVEMSKYFGGRTGTSLGMTGGKGAEESLRLLAFLRERTGMESTMVGEGTSSFFREYLKAKQGRKRTDPLGEIKKLTGVDIRLFDGKGKFLGAENAVAELAKLKGKLNDEKLTSIGSKISGDAGGAMFSAMVQYGDQYKSFNKDADETVSLLDKQKNSAGNLTMKIEALTGSLENLGAEGFKPLLNPLGEVTDKTNEWVGTLTEAAKGQPVFAATTASVLTLGSTLLTLKAGSSILSSLAGRFGVVTEAAVASTSKVGGLWKSLTSLPTALKIGLTVMIAAEAWEQIQKMRSVIDDWKKMNSGTNEVGAGQYKAQQQEDEIYKEKNVGTENKSWAKDGMMGTKQAPDYKDRAQNALSLLNQGNNEFAKALDPTKLGWYEWYGRGIGSLVGKDTNLSLYQGKPTTADILANPQYSARVKQVERMPFKTGNVDGAFKDAYERVASEIAAVKNLQMRAPMLNDPNTMKSFRQDALPAMNLSDVKRQFVEQLLSSAFPASFAQSSQAMEQNSSLLNQSFLNMIQPTNSVADQMLNLNTNSNQAVTGVNSLATATNDAANRLNSVQFTPPIFAPIRIPVFGQAPAPSPVGNIFGRAKGGSVTKHHEYRINEVGQEFFTPNQSGSIVANDSLRKGGRGRSATNQTINFSPTVNVNSDNPNADKILSDVRRELAMMKKEFEQDFTPDRLAQKVEFAAQRDAERT